MSIRKTDNEAANKSETGGASTPVAAGMEGKTNNESVAHQECVHHGETKLVSITPIIVLIFE